MPIVSLQKGTPSLLAHQGAHCLLPLVSLRSVAQALTSLRARQPDGNTRQRGRAGSATFELSHQRALASSYREPPRSGVTDRSRTLPLTREAILLATPVLVVAVPWILGHLQLCLAVVAVVALSPFGTVIWSLVPHSLGKPFVQQHFQQRRTQRPWQNTKQRASFWPAESRILRDPPLVVEADVFGPSDEEFKSRSSTPYRAQAMPHAQKYQHSSAHATRDRSMPSRQAERRHRRVGAVDDNADTGIATVRRSVPARAPLQQAAQEFVAPVQSTASGFWQDKPLLRRRKGHLLAGILRRVPFVGSWGGLL